MFPFDKCWSWEDFYPISFWQLSFQGELAREGGSAGEKRNDMIHE
jgi:hypothetical protein